MDYSCCSYESFFPCKTLQPNDVICWNNSDETYNILIMNDCVSNDIQWVCNEADTSECVGSPTDTTHWNKWCIKLQDLKNIPPYYPIDLTYKVLHSTTIENVNRRLSEGIKKYDLAVEWSPKNPSLLYCSTNDFISFEINLWKKSYKEPRRQEMKTSRETLVDIIVEIRRHDGDCVKFHHLRNALYTGIFHGNFVNLTNTSGNYRIHGVPSTNSIGPQSMRPLAFDTLMDIMNSVAMAFELIFSENSLDVTMGFQMLLFLTDPTSMSSNVYAGHVCDFILLGSDVFGNTVGAVPKVIHNYIMIEQKSIGHHYALQILANVFENNSFKYEIPQESLNTIESWNSVIPSLVRDLKNVDSNPHVAYNALKCFRKWYLFAGNTIVDPVATERVRECLESIRNYGCQQYSSLEIEAKKLIFLLDNSSKL